MPHGTKIVTCCYCGTRAALVLRGESRHELSCAACGAPLHDMKLLRADAVETPVSSTKVNTHRPVPKQRRGAVTPMPVWEREVGYSRKKKKKKRKTLAKRFFEEAFDVLEDIFD
ncbi:hypothetical protein [uncultured Marivita sp.]|uniref:hypothetical protein n=1 Tax=uncultured Marivita sp. TaxID=888080 RepID=UPI002611E9ED|nr:hypothetical protein [uncultured Marivita sp.]